MYRTEHYIPAKMNEQGWKITCLLNGMYRTEHYIPAKRNEQGWNITFLLNGK